jgi:hypothetical protein
VVIQFLTYEHFHEPHREIIEIQLRRMGMTHVVDDGLAYEVSWNHSLPNQIKYLTMENGDRYSLDPGVTFYQFIG